MRLGRDRDRDRDHDRDRDVNRGLSTSITESLFKLLDESQPVHRPLARHDALLMVLRHGDDRGMHSTDGTPCGES